MVTGGGSGVGKVTALTFAAQGAHIVLAGRRPGPLEEVAKECEALGVQALAVPTDLGDPAAVQALFAACKTKFGRLDILFNNAGTPTRGLRRSRRSRSRRAAEPNRHLPYPGTFTPGVPFEELSLEQCSQVRVG